MRWPWRHHVNGEVKAAQAEADQQLKAAQDKQRQVDATAKAAKDQAKRTDRFAREIERAFHQKRGLA